MVEDNSPSVTLAGRVVERLVAAGLLRPDKAASVAAKVASGTMKSAEWQGEIDVSQDRGDAR